MTSPTPDQVAAEKVADKVLKDLGMGVTWIEDKAWIRSRILDYITTALRQARQQERERINQFRIVDLSAGNRAVWYNKAHPNALFIDIRPEMNPSLVADTRNLVGLVEPGVDLFVFDPPHVNFGANAEMSKTYGWHTTDAIRDIITRTAEEAYRLGRPNALMAFKWNDHDQRLEKVLALMAVWWEPLFGHKVAMRTKHASSTSWVLLKRRAPTLRTEAGEP